MKGRYALPTPWWIALRMLTFYRSLRGCPGRKPPLYENLLWTYGANGCPSVVESICKIALHRTAICSQPSYDLWVQMSNKIAAGSLCSPQLLMFLSDSVRSCEGYQKNLKIFPFAASICLMMSWGLSLCCSWFLFRKNAGTKCLRYRDSFGLQWWCAAVPWGIGWLGRNQLGGELWCAEWVLRFRNDWGGSRAMVLQNQEISLQKEMLTTDCHNIVIPLHSWHVRVLSFDFLKSHPEALAGGD